MSPLSYLYISPPPIYIYHQLIIDIDIDSDRKWVVNIGDQIHKREVIIYQYQYLKNKQKEMSDNSLALLLHVMELCTLM